MSSIKASLPALLGVMLAMHSSGQEPTFRSQSNVVFVPALVKDEAGNPVYGLEARDFLIRDDGIEQRARLDEASESEPVFLMLALQRGRRASREFARVRGLGSMLGPVFAHPGSQVALVEFDSTVLFLRDFTPDLSAIAGDLQQLHPGDGGAAILDAVQFSLRMLDRTPAGYRKVLLLISETRDHGSHLAKLEDVVTSLGNGNTVVYALPFSPALSQMLDTERGSNQDEWGSTPNLLAPLVMATQAMRKNTPKAIAGMTGGEYQVFASRQGFENDMTSFTNHLHSRYVLSFEPQNPHPGLHQIRVQMREPGKRVVLARRSYWAERNPPQPSSGDRVLRQARYSSA